MNEAEILEAEARLRAAMFNNDVVALDHLLDDALMFTALDGSIAGKQDDLAAHRARRLRLSRMDVIERRLLDCGETVIVNVLMDHAGSWDGLPVAGKLRYTRVWQRRPEGWKIVAGHMSAVTEQL